MLWRESTLERVRKCKRVPIMGGDVLIRDNVGTSHYVGVATCGSIWACPVCGANIRNKRSQEISEATARWDGRGGGVYMATFTAPHDLGMRLKPLFSVISDGFRAVLSGRAWAGESRAAYAKRVACWEKSGRDRGEPEPVRRPGESERAFLRRRESWEVSGKARGRDRPVRTVGIKERLGIVGQIRSMEVTYGEHGWHPHLHVLIYTEDRLGDGQAEELRGYLRERWSRFIVKAGYRQPHDDHGVKVDRCVKATEAGKYIAKTQEGGRNPGNELARGDLKQGGEGGRTPLEILDDFRWNGDSADLRLWREYEQVTHGRQCITWSKGLREILGADPERSNEELAAEEVGGDDVAFIPGQTWKAITRMPGLPAALLDASERGGLDGVNVLLRRYGIDEVGPPPELIGPAASAAVT